MGGSTNKEKAKVSKIDGSESESEVYSHTGKLAAYKHRRKIYSHFQSSAAS